MKFTNDSTRLTWAQIEERYPHQWVGLKDVEYDEYDANIISAVVAETGTRDEMLDSQIIYRRVEDAVLTQPEMYPEDWVLCGAVLINAGTLPTD